MVMAGARKCSIAQGSSSQLNTAAGNVLVFKEEAKTNPQNSPLCSPSYKMVLTFTNKIMWSFREMLPPESECSASNMVLVNVTAFCSK